MEPENQDAKKIIHIDFWEAEVDKDYQPDVEVVGDLADALWQLNEAIKNVKFEGKSVLFFGRKKSIRPSANPY